MKFDGEDRSFCTDQFAEPKIIGELETKGRVQIFQTTKKIRGRRRF